MGITISSVVTISLDCDACLGNVRCGYRESGTDYVSFMTKAKALGWLERQGDDGRKFLCPSCSGKVTDQTELAL